MKTKASRPSQPNRPTPRASGLNIPRPLRARLNKAAHKVRLLPEDLLIVGAKRVLREIEETGALVLHQRPILEPKLEARLRELDVAIDAAKGDGVAQLHMEGIIRDVKEAGAKGRDTMGSIVGGYQFKTEADRVAMVEAIIRMGRKWNGEDRASKGKGGKSA